MTPTPVSWSVRCRGRLLDCGTARGSDREVLEAIMTGRLGSVQFKDEERYSISAGSSVASACGDELGRVLGCSTIDESKLEEGGHLFPDLSKAQERELEAKRIAKLLDDDKKSKERAERLARALAARQAAREKCEQDQREKNRKELQAERARAKDAKNREQLKKLEEAIEKEFLQKGRSQAPFKRVPSGRGHGLSIGRSVVSHDSAARQARCSHTSISRYDAKDKPAIVFKCRQCGIAVTVDYMIAQVPDVALELARQRMREGARERGFGYFT